MLPEKFHRRPKTSPTKATARSRILAPHEDTRDSFAENVVRDERSGKKNF